MFVFSVFHVDPPTSPNLSGNCRGLASGFHGSYGLRAQKTNKTSEKKNPGHGLLDKFGDLKPPNFVIT